MDNAEQSPRVPNRGSFDTASLLAPSTTIFNAQSSSSVQSSVPHLTHSPSAFSVLGRNAVLVPPPLPPPSSKSDASPAKSGGKMCSPIIHQSASDALSSLASSSAVVEEVLGHLYAKPPSAEFKAETQTSGIHDAQQLPCKSTLPGTDIQSPAQLNSLNVIPPDKDFFLGKNEKHLASNVQNSAPSAMTVSSTSLLKPASKKPEEETVQLIVPTPKVRKRRSSKAGTSEGGNSKAGKKSRANSERNKSRSSKKPKEKAAKTLSSASDDSSSSSSGSESSCAGVSSNGSCDSTDEEEREKQQQKLARLKKQQKELRRKVQELKQASHESNQQKADAHNKKLPSSKAMVSPKAVNHSKKPMPSPAHSSSALAVSPKTAPLKPKMNACADDDANMSVPLDLCVKKQEPTFEVPSSSFHNAYPPLMGGVKKPLNLSSTFTPQGTQKLPATTPKRRGRKPKYLVGSNMVPEVAHQFKQNNVHDLSSMLLPQKLLSPPTSSSRNSDANSYKKSINSSSLSKSPMFPGDIPNPVSMPRKNFTLDSLLGESNGTVEAENNSDMMPSSSLSNRSFKSKERLRYSNRIKRLEDRGREFETLSKPESSSATDSDPDNEHSDSEESVSGQASALSGHKRSCDEDGEDFGVKRRRVVPDEREIQIPLEHGWRRETKIRCFSRAGVRGEVTYYTPCGKKLKSYPEVARYLIRNGITDISRDNFTFSTKVNVGDFLEVTSSGAGEEYVLLSEQEVVARINEVRARKGRLGVQSRKGLPRSSEQEEQQRQWEQKQLQHQLEQQEMLRQARESKILKQLRREQALMAARNEKKMKAEEARRQKEQQRMLKQQERFERMEQMRIEREIRAQQALEEQEMKRQQAAFLREQERERRRQHMMLVRALETRKKQEVSQRLLMERERKREEILYEKRINREKKMEQRRIELDYLRELKKPVEDMMLKDNSPFPKFDRIPGLKLSGKAFADALMVFEFLHNFGETLGFDSDSLPTLNTLQMALLNLDEKFEEELLSITHHLLVCVIEDPGVPHCPEAATVLGQNLKDADITNNNVSEVLRLYFTAVDKRSKMCHWLQAKPFLALTSSQKAEILAYLCDDLLGSRVLMRKIDSNIENVNVLRKDKWLIEGDLRRLKTVQQRRLLKAKQQTYEESKLGHSQSTNAATADSPVVGSSNTTKDGNMEISDVKDSSECDKEKLDDLDNDNESGNESYDERNDSQATVMMSDAEDEDLQLSNEELTKKVDKLTKQLSAYSNRLTKALHTIRAVTFGQDRFHRRYWVLPKCGGVYVESMESSELPHNVESILASSGPDAESSDKNTEDLGSELKKEEPNLDVKEGSLEQNEVEKEEQTLELPDEKHEFKPIINASEHETPSTLPIKPDVEVGEVVKDPSEIEIKPEVAEGDEKDVEKSDLAVKESSEKQADSHSKEKDVAASLDFNFKKEPEPEKKMSSENQCNSEKANPFDFSDKKPEKKPEVNIFMPKFCDNIGLDSCPTLNHSMLNSSDHKPPMNPSIPTNQNWLLHSPFFASLLAGNLMFNGPMMPGRETNGTYFNLPKNDFNNPFGPFLGAPNMLTPEQLYKSLSDKQSNQKPWFSILPRMPCDEDSLPKSQQSKNMFPSPLYSAPQLFSSGTPNSSQGTKMSASPSAAHSTPSSVPPNAGQLSSLQMEILNGVPPGFFLHPFLPQHFGPTFQSGLPQVTCSSSNSFTPTMSHSSPMADFGLNLGRPPASSTPSSIPTPSATPGPSQGCSTPTFRDSPTPSIKRLMMEKMTQEYDKPKPIPQEYQKSWWRITDSSQLKDLVNALHHRGIREKMLQKHLQKHFNYACNSCSQGQDQDIKLEINEYDEKIANLPDGLPVPDNEEDWSREVALRVDLAILEQIENLEEKIDGASMQVKGWKPPPKLSVEPSSKFIPACELYLQLHVDCDVPDSPREKTPKKSSKRSARKRRSEAAKRKAAEAELAEAAIEAKTEDADAEEKPEESAKEAVDEKEKCEEAEPEKEPEDTVIIPPGKINPVEEAKKRLLMVEAAIERRYLKPPLGYSSNDLSRNAITGSHPSSSENGDEDIIPTGLQKWRNAVQACRSSSQLAMCVNYLENFTAWDKSIMRASCQFCHSGENEEMLLLCDGCDKGYHTYCFKPKMEKIPEGDWYCYECLNKATGDNVCVICGKKGKLIDCGSCPKCFHLSCLEPPLSKMPKGKWYCSGCSQARPAKKSYKKSTPVNKEKEKETKESSNNKKTESESKPAKPKGGEKKERKEKNRSQVTEDFAPCSLLVDEMEKHDDSWPFLSPVNTKQFPTYRKVIKKPMDLATVRSKLDANQYKSREDFASDVRLIFDNCETFNEDDSPVGQAGHTMRAFFDTRWSELCNT